MAAAGVTHKMALVAAVTAALARAAVYGVSGPRLRTGGSFQRPGRGVGRRAESGAMRRGEERRDSRRP